MDTVIEVAHSFEIELSILVVENHRLTMKGIKAFEDEELAKAEEALSGEPDGASSHVAWIQEFFFNGMRRSANHFAVVGLVTVVEQWIRRFAQSRKLKSKKNGGEPPLCGYLHALNDYLHEEPPVSVAFFADLITARDSVIHGGSRAEWTYKGERTVAAQDRNGPDLEVTVDGLNAAIESAKILVKGYDSQIQAMSAKK